VRGECQIDVVAVGIVEAGADDRGLQIVVTHDARHTAEVAKRALVEPEERLELLIPDRFLIAVPRMPERHPEDPRPSPLAGGRVERRGAAEEIGLRFGTRGTVEDADGAPPRRQRPHKPLHRFVAGAVAVLLDQVLPDAVYDQPRIELLGDRRPIEGRREPRSRWRAEERFGPICRRPGERVASIWIVARLKIRGFRGGDASEPGNVLAAFERRIRS
jgi:hypothetical protein